jgi:AcrR family transcriptional regulator
MDDIAAESGLSKGSLYWYFDSKSDLFAEVIAGFFEGQGESAMHVLANHDAYSDKLRAGVRLMVEMVSRSQGMFGLFLEFWAQSDNRETASQHWAEVLTHYEKVIAGIIEDGVHSGEFRPVDAESLVWAIMAAFDGLAAYAVLVPELDLVRTSTVFVETLLSGLDMAGEG